MLKLISIVNSSLKATGILIVRRSLKASVNFNW